MDKLNDWRLQGQEKYLQGVTLIYKNYFDRKTETDHDHTDERDNYGYYIQKVSVIPNKTGKIE